MPRFVLWIIFWFSRGGNALVSAKRETAVALMYFVGMLPFAVALRMRPRPEAEFQRRGSSWVNVDESNTDPFSEHQEPQP